MRSVIARGACVLWCMVAAGGEADTDRLGPQVSLLGGQRGKENWVHRKKTQMSQLPCDTAAATLVNTYIELCGAFFARAEL